MTTSNRPEIRKIAQFNIGTVRAYWVGLGRPTPEQIADDDYTCPEVTNRYVSKAALLAAIENGTAFEVSK